MNRRELLKLFGVGATVVPIVGGAAVESAAATLIEIPKVELASADVFTRRTQAPARILLGPYHAELVMVHGETGQRWEMEVEEVEVKQMHNMIDVSTSYSSMWQMILEHRQEAQLLVRGGMFRRTL